MRITVIAVGKIKEPGLRAAVDDYLKRIGRYARVEEHEIKDGDEADVDDRFRRAIVERAQVVALEVGGKAWSSERFAKFIGDSENDGTYSIAFLIGGSYGLSKAVRSMAKLSLSLSPMTLPHRLARLVLVEQIYRAFTILRNEPYSH
jgi:23S rRNA (pseudouridine1915-N3)-methyltransferase